MPLPDCPLIVINNFSGSPVTQILSMAALVDQLPALAHAD
jgi:hypothetical protein